MHRNAILFMLSKEGKNVEEKKIFEKMKFLECSFEKINQTEELAFSCHFTESCINRFF